MSGLIKNQGFLKKGIFLCGGTSFSGSWTSGPSGTPIPIFRDVSFNDSDSISILSTTQIKLLAGKKYKLLGQFGASVGSTYYAYYRWWNVTAGDWLGNQGLCIAASYGGQDGSSDGAHAIIAPLVDTTLEFKISSAPALVTSALCPSILIEEVEAYMPQTQYNYRKGTALIGKSSEGAVSIGNTVPIPIFESAFFNDSSSIIILSNTQIKLLAGKKYHLSAELVCNAAAFDAWIIWQFYNITTAAYIGFAGRVATVTATTYVAASSFATLDIVPTVDTTLELRNVSGGTTISWLFTGCKVTIEEVEAYLPVANTENGRYLLVNNAYQLVKTKYLTGTTAASTGTIIAHGLTASKILSLSIIINNAGGTIWTAGIEQFIGTFANESYQLYINGSNLEIATVGSQYQSQSYRIKIEYYD